MGQKGAPKPKFLLPGARKGDGRGYTDKPALGMRGEPECVGPAIVDAYAESARFFDSVRHAAEVEQRQEIRRGLTLEQRLADAQRRAKARHVNLSHEFHIMKRMLDRARMKGREPHASAERRMLAIEERLD